MYILQPFEMKDMQRIKQLIRDHSFGLLCSTADGIPTITHLPMILQEQPDGNFNLLGHMTKANQQWKQMSGEVLAVFQGPHAYISPAWYQEPDTVPTWNYTAVHIRGRFEQIEDPGEVRQVIQESNSFFESLNQTGWKTDLDTPLEGRLLEMIVAFRIHATHIEGKWKLSQNHPIERQERVIEALMETGREDAARLAEYMRQELSCLQRR